ncbi:MAG: DNA repair protein RadA [Hydrogenophilus sp.]|nr:DNA repair protein RadA [Hydrogenophilus sp.]
MGRSSAVFRCTACGSTLLRWQGQCPQCGAWNSVVEVEESPPKGEAVGRRHLTRPEAATAASSTVAISAVERHPLTRLRVGIGEWDRVLGGGLVPGAVVLLGGDPGVGKSTLVLQCLAALEAAALGPTLYVTGEESPEQVAMRADRLGLGETPVPLLAEVELEPILEALAATKPRVAVIDSIQTLYTPALSSAPGSVGQVRECASQLTRFAKSSGTALILIGHVTKEGSLAGPRVLEHMVDTVLYFEGDSNANHRLIRAFKNRFGAANELGVFVMTDKGLRGVNNPSAIFLAEHRPNVAGSVVLPTIEGTRPLLVEIQALVDQAISPNPRRLAVGVDANRVAMLLAILHRHAGVRTAEWDVFINAVGGVRIGETAGDLAVAAAILSSLRNQPLPVSAVVFGEVGLAGEVRPVPRGQERLREAAKLGFQMAWVPRGNAPKQEVGLKVIAVGNVSELLSSLFGY